MITVPATRRRETAVVSRHQQNQDERKNETSRITDAEDYREIMRRAFEAQFAPIDPDLLKPVYAESEEPDIEMSSEDEEAGDNDWLGLSDEDEDGEDGSVAVVDHTCTGKKPDDLDLPDKQTRKKFMNSKPPSSTNSKPSKPQNSKKSADEENTDALNLQHDLSLQRLLKESHLLEGSSDLDPTGVNRHKAFDLRMQSLGAKTSLYKQEKMPMSHRKGITSKATRKEEVRRREARENGIILEKPMKQKSKMQRRERGVGGPAVGKFAGGTLRLSQRDISTITGPKRSATTSKAYIELSLIEESEQRYAKKRFCARYLEALFCASNDTPEY
ncbi:hypothetical protein KEM54_005894 [Ascosphaera aggregata]|nr:hypothetical protein KEM54_005894 [Ascosphaera aggregata]